MTLFGQGTGVSSFTVRSGMPAPRIAFMIFGRYSENSAINRVMATGGHSPGRAPVMSVTSMMSSSCTTPMWPSPKRAIFINRPSRYCLVGDGEGSADFDECERGGRGDQRRKNRKQNDVV